MDRRVSRNSAPGVASAAPKHNTKFGEQPVTTLFDQAIRELVPDNDTRKIVSLFQGRVGRPAICHWRVGRRKPPWWALDIVARALEARAQLARRVRAIPAGDTNAGAKALARWRATRHLTKEKPRD
jgi:hypothetical protein